MKLEDLHKTVVEIEKLVAGLVSQIGELTKSLATLTENPGKTVQNLHDLRVQHEKELVALKKDIDELRRWSEKNGISDLKALIDVLKEKVAKLEAALDKVGTRAWSVVPNVAGAIVNVILAAIVALVVTKFAK